MTIEKISDNQIRCTLTRADLEEHQVDVSQLAYGNENAKKLFQEMMNQAQIQFGFQSDNTPLMIEAIPVSSESIVLIITKVEDPEELDTRFSKFAPFKHSGGVQAPQFGGADEILDLFSKLRDAVSSTNRRNHGDSNANAKNTAAPTAETAEGNGNIKLMRVYHFEKMNQIIEAAHSLKGSFEVESALYKGYSESGYDLIVHQADHTPEDFNKICNILSEYANGKNCPASTESFLLEHGHLIGANALQNLAEL